MSKLRITVTPVRGKTKTVEVDATHSTVRAALTAAKLSLDAFQVSVNGQPANLDTVLAGGAQITLTEKVRGS